MHANQLRDARTETSRAPVHDQSKFEFIPSVQRILQPLVEMAGSFASRPFSVVLAHRKQLDIGYPSYGCAAVHHAGGVNSFHGLSNPQESQRVENRPAYSKKHRNYQIKARKIRARSGSYFTIEILVFWPNLSRVGVGRSDLPSRIVFRPSFPTIHPPPPVTVSLPYTIC
ncbi:hypothetical protein BDM02DRAFT_1283737 [Thelephora ganbajun]|uniref:Uncharacterized protein n=1 Tax=Thelephora ganbajun TaxID=370292 RepID=A0ACB6Z319_THEGA|nr:hypothetical protein BDM02DRAFT_1283737 [Thelephora ganbajun]